MAALIGCGQEQKKKNDAASEPSEAQKEIIAHMEQTAPKFIISIADKDGQIISTQTSDKMPEGATNEEIALNIIKNKDKANNIKVLSSDDVDSQEQSTESYFWHGGGHGYGHGYGYGWGGRGYGWNAGYSPVYAYAQPGYGAYYGGYNYNCGAPVAYGAAAYTVAVYNYASAYSYAPVGGCGYGYAAAYGAAGCAQPYSYPSYY